jgi:hypothetical protein
MANVLPRPCTCTPRDPRKSIREVSPIALHEKWHTERMAKEEDAFYRRGATVGKGLSHFTRASIGYWKWGKAFGIYTQKIWSMEISRGSFSVQQC